MSTDFNSPPATNRRDEHGSHGNSGGHSCFDKAREIRRRTGIILGLDTHDIISEMCREWGVQNADEFYMRMNAMSDDQLKAEVEEAKRRLQRRKVKKPIQEMVKETLAYA